MSNLDLQNFQSAAQSRASFSSSLRRMLTAAAVAGLTVLAGCSAMQAQNPSEGYGPVNAVPGESGERLMLKGYDVVSYFTDNKHAMGSSANKSLHKGVTFHFASAAHKELFDKTPEKYLPQFGGYCANGIVYGIPWGGDGDSWTMHEGKLYIFGGAGSKAPFMLDVPANVKLANQYWSEEVNGSHSFIQRSKRLTFKVPHYKSGEDLAKMVEAAKVK